MRGSRHLRRDTVTTWIAALVVAAVAAVSTGGVGMLHRHTEHSSPHLHSHNDAPGGHCHHDSDQPEDTETPDSPEDHGDCDLCLLLMSGGQWTVGEVLTPTFQANAAVTPLTAPQKNVCVPRQRVLSARGPPARSF